MNQTQRKQLHKNLLATYHSKLSIARTSFLKEPNSKFKPIPNAVPYSMSEMMLGLMKQEGGAPFKVTEQEVIDKIKKPSFCKYGITDLITLFPYKNQKDIDEVIEFNKEITDRSNHFYAGKEFIINQIYQDNLDTLEVNDNFEISSTKLAEFQAFVP